MQTYYSKIEIDVDMHSGLYAFTRQTLTNRLEGPTNRQTVFIQPVYVCMENDDVDGDRDRNEHDDDEYDEFFKI